MLLILAVALVVPAWILGAAGLYAPLAIVASLMIATVLLLGWLRVTVDASAVQLRFGIGIIRKQWALSDLRGSRIVRNAWYQGTGIRMIRNGWLYNVAGRQAVELALAGNHVARVGTDDAERLLAAIHSAAGLTRDANAQTPHDESAFNWRAALIMPFLGIVGVLIFMDLRPPIATVDANTLTVRSGTYKSVIPIRDISSVVVSDTLPSIAARTNGFRLGDALRGHFRLTSLGNAMLFVDRDHPPYVMVRSVTALLIVGFRDEARTRELIAALARRPAP